MERFMMATRVFPLIDASGSMCTLEDNKTRWERMQETVSGMVGELAEHCGGSLLLTFFNGAGMVHPPVSSYQDVATAFGGVRPKMSTPLDIALQWALQKANLAVRDGHKTLIPIFFDGAPDSELAVETLIRTQANSQTADDDVTIAFCVVGNDPAPKAWLQKLDSRLNTKLDIVCVMQLEEAARFGSVGEWMQHCIDN